MRRTWTVLLLAPSALAAAVDYDIVYVRAPRPGDAIYAPMPEVINPVRAEPGWDLMLLHPDGREEVLFAAGDGAVLDPAISFDAQWVWFSYIPDARPAALNSQRSMAPRGGADIYKIHVKSREVVRITTQVWTPPSGEPRWSRDHLRADPEGSFYLGYGIFNLGPCPLPGGKVMFTSSRDGYLPTKSFTFPNLRLYVMDEDGRNVEPIGHLNMGSALHPAVLTDGRVMFSSYEPQGLRDERVWGLWSIYPDGRYWEPLMSAFVWANALHFQTQLSDGRVAVTEYYNLNNNGFGTLLAFEPRGRDAQPRFGSPVASDASNPEVRRGLWFFQPGHEAHLRPRYKRYPFSPPGLAALTGFTHGEDEAASLMHDGSYAGKATHPSGAPGNDVLLVWTPGPANNLNRPATVPRYDGGIYLLRSGEATDDPRSLVLVKNDPRYNELQPRALVPYASIYGVAEPASIPWLPDESGTPFGLIGSASLTHRDTAPGNGLDPFNTTENEPSTNWFTQGADAGKYSDSDIAGVRILAMESVAHRSYGPGIGAGRDFGFRNHAGAERLRILGEISVSGGDTSFLARIPADTPFTFQTLDKDGMALNMAQTWHQVRPGETRTDCGGCHAHSQRPMDFAKTAAGRGERAAADLTGRPVDVEYYRDIKPLLQRSCVACHAKNGRAEAGLILDDEERIDGYDGTFYRLAGDEAARWGIPPVIESRNWRGTNASRYIRKFQSRRSLLMWKILGRRTDGWTNADFPTERVPGDRATLPAGAHPNRADLDFTGSIMPPPDAGAPPLSDEEKRRFARWIDLGCPISSPDEKHSPMHWFADELKPALTLASPRAGEIAGPLREIRLGMFDAYSGIDRDSLEVTASFAVNGRAPGENLASGFRETVHGVWTLALEEPLAAAPDARVTVRVKDRAGNATAIDRAFRVPPPAVN